MVIGPTPPGTGVIAPAMPLQCHKIDIADDTLAAIRPGHRG